VGGYFLPNYINLVRDLVTNIIHTSSKIFLEKNLSNFDYYLESPKKVIKELAEYRSANKSNVDEEIADLQEGIYAILKFNQFSIEEIEQTMLTKLNNNGCFGNRVILVEVRDE
jgi:predicted house-cleaning noncanonical NTP pyrophosphatase (MazG superfamily)